MNLIVTTVLVAISIALTAKIVKDLGVNKVIYSHTPGECKYVAGVEHGSEDLVALPNGMVLGSSTFYVPFSSREQKPGHLFIYDPSKDPPKAEPLLIEGGSGWKSEDFFPLGVAVWQEKNGETTVYAINSRTRSIHFFQLKLNEKKLILRKTVRHNGIANANNLVPVARDKFYVTNFGYFENTAGLAAEIITKLPLGSVWYYNGNNFEELLSGLKGPNGIALSNSKKFLYVATHTEESVRVYQIQPSSSTPTLTLVNTIPLHTGVDNVNVDKTGALWIGCHPVAYKSLFHLYDRESNSAPSQVLKVTFGKNEDHSRWNIEEVFADDGTRLQGSASALPTGTGQLVIGTAFHKAMVCKMEK